MANRVIFAATTASDDLDVLTQWVTWRMDAAIIARLIVGAAATTRKHVRVLS